MEIKVKLPKGEASTSFSGLSTEEESLPLGADTQRQGRVGSLQERQVSVGSCWCRGGLGYPRDGSGMGICPVLARPRLEAEAD